MISIICNTYNQRKYIAETLNGFIIQKTNFPFEVLVHDDASTDKTADIIREYEKKYPEIIKPIYETENQYSKHDGTIGRLQRERAKGKYIAFCEGDDYWTDPYKLQKQFDIMEAHPEIDMCAHGANCIDSKTNRVLYKIAPSETETILGTKDTIQGGGAFLATNSLFYRASLLENVPQFRKTYGIDYSLQILGSLRGGIYYIPDIMSVYRVMVPGSWSEKYKNNADFKLDQSTKIVAMLNQLDIDTNKEYHDVIEAKIINYKLVLLDSDKKRFQTVRTEYKSYYKTLSYKEKLKFYMKAYFPWIKDLYRKIKYGKK